MIERYKFILLFFIGIAFYWLAYNPYRINPVYIDPDSTYQVKRVKDCLDNYPKVQSHDSNSHYPTGMATHWENFYTFALASIVKLTELGCQRDMSHILSFVPVLVGLLALLFLYCILKKNKAPLKWFWLYAPFALFAPECSSNFYLGTIDHHAFIQLAVFLLISSFWFFRKSVYVCALFFCFFFSPESMVFGTLFLCLSALLILNPLWDSSPFRKQLFSKPVLVLWPGCFSFVSYGVHWLLELERTDFFSFSVLHKSLFQPVWFLSLGVLLWLYIWLYQSHKSNKVLFGKIILVSFVFGVLWGFLFWESGMLDLIIKRFSNPSRLFVAEESSPLFFPSFTRSFLHYKLYLVYLALSVFLAVKSRFRDPKWVVLSVVILFGITEMRFLKVISTCMMLFFVQGCRDVWRLVSMGQLKRKGVLFAQVLLTAVMSFALIQLLPARLASRTEREFLHIVGELESWSKMNQVTKQLQRGTNAILCPWSLGHHVNYFTNSGVLVDPFNFPVPIEPTLKEIFSQKNTAEFLSLLRGKDTEWVIYYKPLREYQNIMREQKSEAIHTLPYRGFNMFVYDSDGLDVPFLKPAYSLNAANFEFGFQVSHFSDQHELFFNKQQELLLDKRPKFQIFRIVPGMTVSGRVPDQSSQISIGYTIVNGLGERREMRYVVPVSEDGSFSINIANPAPSMTSGLRILTPYILRSDTYQAKVFVSTEQIEKGSFRNHLDWVLK